MPNTRRRQTRRRSNQRGGIFGFGSTPAPQQQAKAAFTEAQYIANVATSRAKSRVANYLGAPGNFTYTNKNRIQGELADRISQIEEEFGVSHAEIMSGVEAAQTTSPKDVMSTISQLKSQLESQLTGSTAAAVTLTIPVGVAQLAVKAFRIMLAIAIFVFATIPAGLMGVNTTTTTLAMSAALPNTNFSTTAKSFAFLKNTFKKRSSPNSTNMS